MNPARRAMAMLADPSAEWARIERESGDPAFLLSRYVAVLALIPAIFGFVGASRIGAMVPGVGPVRATLFDGGFGAIAGQGPKALTLTAGEQNTDCVAHQRHVVSR